MFTNTIKDTHTRVTVQVPGHTVDINLARDRSVAAIVTVVVPHVRKALADVDDEVVQWLGDKDAVWQFATTLGAHLAADKSLADLGVVDGEVLVLTKSDQRETYPPLIDDVAESIAFAQRNMAAWTSASARMLASFVAPVVALVAVMAVVYGTWSGALGNVGQVAACGALLVLAVGLIVGAALGLRKIEDPSTRQLAGAVILVGYVCVAGAGMLAIPGTVDVFSVVTAAVMMTTVAVIGLTTVGYPVRLHYGAATFGGLVLIACLLTLITDHDPLVFAVILGAAALLFLLFASRLSLVLAGIPMPFVPTMGETFVHDDSDDITTVESGSGAAAITAIINQEQQVQNAYQCIVGLTWGALSAIAMSAVLAAANMDHHQSAVMVFYVVITIALLFRGKSFEDTVISRSWLVAAAATYAAFVLTLAFTASSFSYALIGLGILAVGTGAACYVAIREKVINSPIVLKLLEIIESLSFAAPIVLIVVILDGYNKVRGR